ncbi:phage tail assembly protein T [Pasteurella bettyae]|uniref:phage tail assembly protein T n=1 Tax=Pasteurella bettyae TaxID=752 RepID=UPI003D2B901A
MALALGKSLSEIDQLSERELAEWELFAQEQPFGLWRDDYRTAQISHLLAMINRNPKAKDPELMEFMPFFKSKDDVADDGFAEYLANR